ncbi:MAG: hypothetical protein V9H26_17845 [Verrucomicrobiota bacterium]
MGLQICFGKLSGLVVGDEQIGLVSAPERITSRPLHRFIRGPVPPHNQRFQSFGLEAFGKTTLPILNQIRTALGQNPAGPFLKEKRTGADECIGADMVIGKGIEAKAAKLQADPKLQSFLGETAPSPACHSASAFEYMLSLDPVAPTKPTPFRLA